MKVEVIPKLKDIMPLKNTCLLISQRLKGNTLKEILLITPLKKTLLIIPSKVHSIPHFGHLCVV